MGSGLDHCLLQLTSRQALGFYSAGLLTTTPNSAKCSVFLPFAHVSNALFVPVPLQILCFCQDWTPSSVPVNTVPTMRSLFWNPEIYFLCHAFTLYLLYTLIKYNSQINSLTVVLSHISFCPLWTLAAFSEYVDYLFAKDIPYPDCLFPC